ncbi:hypothetical protein PISMIDRAFT_620108 [Pisolithus microcarpus 441]|uniref:Unplaced genomic scaffold scaffold_96, whole genome shotgun sequence n=1 Tax=Pisolithus microcarpus 441 TaxID=765257 RepID=A0A0C9ZI74_9AGAM|nr:hypothetical protein PISMIDRAFT_620108 [Pisolithus microcarpus 441]
MTRVRGKMRRQGQGFVIDETTSPGLFCFHLESSGDRTYASSPTYALGTDDDYSRTLMPLATRTKWCGEPVGFPWTNACDTHCFHLPLQPSVAG